MCDVCLVCVLCVSAGSHMSQSVCVEVNGQLLALILSFHCRFWGWNSGCWSWAASTFIHVHALPTAIFHFQFIICLSSFWEGTPKTALAFSPMSLHLVLDQKAPETEAGVSQNCVQTGCSRPTWKLCSFLDLLSLCLFHHSFHPLYLKMHSLHFLYCNTPTIIFWLDKQRVATNENSAWLHSKRNQKSKAENFGYSGAGWCMLTCRHFKANDMCFYALQVPHPTTKPRTAISVPWIVPQSWI